MKKITIDRNPQSEANLTEYQVKGHYGCDILNFTPDREGISIDPYDTKHQQVEKLVLEEFKEILRREKKPTQQMQNEKREKKWKQKVTEVFLKDFEKEQRRHGFKGPSNVTNKPTHGKT